MLSAQLLASRWVALSGMNGVELADWIQESQLSEIKMNDDDLEALLALLQYLYTYNYKTVSSNTEYKVAYEMRFQVKVYAIADKYDIPELKKLATNRFELTLSKEHKGYESFMFYKVVRDVYTSTPDSDRGLRNLVLKACTKYHDDVLLEPRFVKMADQLPGFWKEYLREVLDYPQEEPGTYRCSICSEMWNSFPSSAQKCLECVEGSSEMCILEESDADSETPDEEDGEVLFNGVSDQ